VSSVRRQRSEAHRQLADAAQIEFAGAEQREGLNAEELVRTRRPEGVRLFLSVIRCDF